MTTPTSILFDMDGVLYSYDFENRLNLLESATGVPLADIRAKIFDSGFEGQADNGDISTDAYIAEIGERLGVDVTLAQWLAARKWAMAPNPMMIDLARQLGTRVETAMLTNNGFMMAENIAELAPELPDIFGDRLFTSAASGCNKEEAAGFTKLLGLLDWDAATTLFVDDDAHYIAAAAEAGLITHHFADIEGFRACLASHGLD